MFADTPIQRVPQNGDHSIIGRHLLAVFLGLVLALTPRSSEASELPAPGPRPGDGQHHVVPPDATVRIYLAQALASLGRAEQLAQQASQHGDVGSFDIERFLGDLRTISNALERFLIPDSPIPGPHVSVEITGQYLHDGLSRRSRQGPPSTVPHKESSRP